MRKYIQITIVITIFFIVVFFRRQNSGDVNISTDNSSQNAVSQPDVNSSNSGTASNAPSLSSGSSSGNSMPMMQSGSKYKSGIYDGSVENAYYGDVQVRVTISNGKLSKISFLQYPNDNNTSSRINTGAMPMLKSEALKAQSAQVDGVSGASYTSQAFQDSLKSALQKAS